ncbi:hypothetical protein HK103_003784 [Boothiomyces macroporosus]|uniref:Uncharacterized protein n=1 Tax=Boothiomyces macroporosus TaxID=261099 RepID=A0AAD5U8N1_9FUNG|nr:hypothetical protein HK103_003784 [Boothiomyces macroporosus]
MSYRISLATQFTGNFKHLKRHIKEVLKRKGVGHILQTTQVNDSQKQTSLFMEGDSNALYTVQTELVSHLQSIFPGIVIQDWQEMASDSPLFGSHIAPTLGSISRDSSGFVEELTEQPTFEISQKPELKWKDYFNSGFIQVVTAIQNGRQVAYEIQSSVESIKEKFVHMTYKRTTVYINIGACITWTQLKQVIEECDDLQIQNPIKKIYSLADGDKSYIQEWFGFKADGHYYVETEDDLDKKYTTMEEFFDKLKTDQDMSDSQVAIAKEKFGEQGITFKQIMATGELALNEAKLKEIGISQLGLRTAILSVIKSNQ